MRKSIIITCLILSGLIILDSLNVGHLLVMFLLAGVIPGTNIALSASTTLELFTLLIGLVIGRLSARAFQPVFARLPILKKA